MIMVNCGLCIKKIWFFQKKRILPFSGKVHHKCLTKFNKEGLFLGVREKALGLKK